MNRKRRQDARKALVAQDRERAVKEAKGPASSAYSLVRRALQMLDQAAGETSGRDEKRALAEATGHLHRGEDSIVSALQARRRSDV